jgi:aldose 1-epimerase
MSTQKLMSNSIAFLRFIFMKTDEIRRLSRSPVLFSYQGEDIYLFTLRNNQGAQVKISNLGTIIQSFLVPDKMGQAVDIVLGLENMEDYLADEYVRSKTYLGAVIGRYANRIGMASFELDGRRYRVTENLPPHQLHGGIEGFDRKAWKVVRMQESPSAKIEFSYYSPDGEEGFPGNLSVNLSFELTDETELIIHTKASIDKACPVNLTHHDYFNLNGRGSIEDHYVEIPASFYLAQDTDYVATGQIIPVAGTIYDFLQVKKAKNGAEGYDQSFILDKDYGASGLAARCFSERSGIGLEVYTDEPTLHFYTGKYLDVRSAKEGRDYSSFEGLCFETQHHTNALNIPHFPSTILHPGQIAEHTTRYRLRRSLL